MFSNQIIVQLKLPGIVKIHSVFHVILLKYDSNNLLFCEWQKSSKFVISEVDQQKSYLDFTLNFKYDR